MSLLTGNIKVWRFQSFLKSTSLNNINNNSTGNINGININQIRTATKKVAGSRTNMRDSAGRRLGAKVAENEPVKIGQILYRQRGTKFYPGENASIGKDHTIFAMEPGYVRFYMDPFHPKRKFIGIALKSELRLPTPHFEPRVRRLGYLPIEDKSKAQFEENNLSRKNHLLKPQILQDLKQRQINRDVLLDNYSQKLSKLIPNLSNEDNKLLSKRYLLIKTHLQNGSKLIESQSIATFIYLQNIKLNLQQQQNSQIENKFDELKQNYLELIKLGDLSISFDNKFNLIPYLSENDRLLKIKELDSQLNSIFNDKNSNRNKIKEQIKSLIYNNNLCTNTERKLLISKYLKTILSEPIGLVNKSDKKQSSISKRWNYVKNKVDIIARSKESFAFK
ncbi:hypothetical protein WICMUC_000729 [Wickerhamomyces mucosus]|uniref:Large ribosomal subunit protein bL27m n=1 Tax=Wickerhamomyces mucosus TaxID=1378264 RepID=A0A9P8PWT1_9ASCO|nr:hypothetical protein WICMUC_000729 [Wickerhamomyces mucosus]